MALCLVLLYLLVAGPSAPAARTRPIHVVLLTPRNDEFWTLAAGLTQAAAEDLGVAFEWLPALNDPKKQLADAMAVLARPVKPDAILLKNFDGTGGPILEAAEKAGVHTIFFEDGFTPDETRRMGRPRERLKYWLGEFLPDHFEAGYDLTQALVARARKAIPKGQIEMLAIAGNMNETSSADRVRGMMVALREHPEVLLHEISAGYWKADAAEIKASRLLQSYPGTRILLTLNDTMPVGADRAVKALQAQGLLTQRPQVGSCGTTPPATADIQQGRVDVSVGGHFLLPAFTLVLAYDYLNGHDFARESTLMRLQMFTFTAENVRRYYETFGRHPDPKAWSRVDFRRFSKAYRPELVKYPFGFQEILDQLGAEEKVEGRI